MEGRRVEGVFLQHTIERSQILEAYKQSQRVQIRVLTLVPEIFFETLGRKGSQFRATVINVNRSKVLLGLPNGYQIEAENQLSLNVNRGDIITLLVENENPLTLQVLSVERGIRNVTEFVKSFVENLPGALLSYKSNDFRNFILNSGIFYENRLLKVLTGKEDISSIMKDEKFTTIKNIIEDKRELLIGRLNIALSNIKDENLKGKVVNIIDALEKRDIRELMKAVKDLKSEGDNELSETLNVINKEIGKDLQKLELITLIQNMLVIERGKRFALAFEEKGTKGSILLSIKESYRIFFNLFYEEGYIGIIMEVPKKETNVLNLTFFTDIPKVARIIERERREMEKLLKETGMELRVFKVVEENKKVFENAIKEEFSEGMFHIRV